MATAKKASKAKPNIFKVRKTAEKKVTKSKATVLDPGTDELKEAVDSFSSLKKQIKHLEGEMTVYKDMLTDFSEENYAERNKGGITGNFKIQGNETQINYIVPARARAKDEAKYDEFVETHGEATAERLLEVDYGSIRLNAEFLSEGNNQELLMTALGKLGQDFLDNVFTSPTYKVTKDAVLEASDIAKNADELRSILTDLQLASYLKA